MTTVQLPAERRVRGGAGTAPPSPGRPPARAEAAPGRILALLRGEAASRPVVDPGLAGGLREWLEDAVAGPASTLPPRSHPVIVDRSSLLEHHFGRPASLHRPITAPLARAAMFGAVFRQFVTTGRIDDPVADSLAALTADDVDWEIADYLRHLPPAERDAVHREVREHAAVLLRRWPPVPRTWLPRTRDRLSFPLAGGRIVLCGVADLVLGPPAGERGSVCLVDVRSREPGDDQRIGLHHLALLETLRSGAPPFRLAAYHPSSGKLEGEDVTDLLLTDAVRRTAACIVSRCRLAASMPETAGGGGDGTRSTGSWEQRGRAAVVTLPAAGLPRSRLLTDRMLAPHPAAPPAADLAILRERLLCRLGALTPVQASGARGPVRVDGYMIRSAVGGRAPAGKRPFHWSPRNARRAIGVAAAGHRVRGDARTPAEAVDLEIDRLVSEARRAGPRPRSLAYWLSVLPAGGRAAVAAEAVTWATRLYGALDWERFEGSVAVGVPDRWWNCPTAPGIGLRGRADVRAVHDRSGPRTGWSEVLLTVLAGRPGPASRTELALAALVDALNRPDRPAPARVVGWWPDCGRALLVDVDLPLLRSVAGAAVAAIRTAGLAPDGQMAA